MDPSSFSIDEYPAAFLSGDDTWTDGDGFFWDEPGTLLASSPRWLGLCGCGCVDENCSFAYAYAKAATVGKGYELTALVPEAAVGFLAQILAEKTDLLDHGGSARASFPSAGGFRFIDEGHSALEGTPSEWLLSVPGAPELAQAFIFGRLQEMEGNSGEPDRILSLAMENPESASAIFLAALSGPIGLLEAGDGLPRLSEKAERYCSLLEAARRAGGLKTSAKLSAAAERLEIEAFLGPATSRGSRPSV